MPNHNQSCATQKRLANQKDHATNMIFQIFPKQPVDWAEPLKPAPPNNPNLLSAQATNRIIPSRGSLKRKKIPSNNQSKLGNHRDQEPKAFPPKLI